MREGLEGKHFIFPSGVLLTVYEQSIHYMVSISPFMVCNVKDRIKTKYNEKDGVVHKALFKKYLN